MMSTASSNKPSNKPNNTHDGERTTELPVPPAAPLPDAERRTRVGTIVWGLVIAVIGGLILAAQLADITFDLGYVFLGLLLGSGLALVIGGLIAATRKNSKK
jgi:hypothetical protein